MNLTSSDRIREAVEREAFALSSDPCVQEVTSYLFEEKCEVFLTGGRVREAALYNSYNGDVDLVVKHCLPSLYCLTSRFKNAERGRLGGFKIRCRSTDIDVVEWIQLNPRFGVKTVFDRYNAFNNCALVSLQESIPSVYHPRFFSSNATRISDINPIGFAWMSAANRNKSFLKTLYLALTAGVCIVDVPSTRELFVESFAYDPVALNSWIARMFSEGRALEATLIEKIIRYD